MPNLKPRTSLLGAVTFGEFTPLPIDTLDLGDRTGGAWRIVPDGDEPCVWWVYVHPSIDMDVVLSVMVPPAVLEIMYAECVDVDERGWDVYRWSYL